MDIVAGSGNDEFYTPAYAIRPLLKYIRKNSVIWCPFDTAQSNFVKLLRDEGHTVTHTHIRDGADFFQMDTPPCDIIISNPPYSCKTEVLERLFQIGKPFAMLLGIVGLFESQRRFDIFRSNPFEIMYLNRRVSYLKDYADAKPQLNPPFSSVYLCSGVLPACIIFEEIRKE